MQMQQAQIGSSQVQPGPAGIGGPPVVPNHWTAISGPMGSMPVTFELVFTDDLPNGSYGEISGIGGKLYVTPGSTYNDVAGALIAAWVKSRGNMMNMDTSVAGGGFMGEDVQSNYSENWKVGGIDYKGGPVTATAPAVAGSHNAKLVIEQTIAIPSPCCVIA